MSTAAIVLAAGFSRRLGRPKQMVVLGGETLLQRAVRIAREAELGPLLVVVHRQLAEEQRRQPMECTVVVNDEAEEGIASSIRAGVQAAAQMPEVDGVVIMTCDQVAQRPEHLRALRRVRDVITGSAYSGGKIAVPAYFPRESFDALLALQGDAGARELLHSAAAIAAEELALDIDTEEDVQHAERRLHEAASGLSS